MGKISSSISKLCLVVLLLFTQASAFADVSPETEASPEYKKCMLQKEMAENSSVIQMYKRMLQDAKEDVKVVGYMTLGNQSKINDAKRAIHETEKQKTMIAGEIKKFSKVSVNCKDMETKLKTAAKENCSGGDETDERMRKSYIEDCRYHVDIDTDLTLVRQQ